MNEHKYMWNHAGTSLLISIWSDSSVQKQLQSKLRNQSIWDGVARFLTRKGFHVNGKQCRTRIKNILVRYRDAKKSGNVTGTGIEPFYYDIDRVMVTKNLQAASKRPRSNPTSSSNRHNFPDPLEPLEQTQRFERNDFENQEMIQLNIKSEINLPSIVTVEKRAQELQDISQDSTHDQDLFQDVGITDDDQSCSSVHVTPAERFGSPNNSNCPTTCKENDNPSPLPEKLHSPESQFVGRSGSLRLEQLVVHAIQAQGEVVTKILTAQHELTKQLLEADRERQLRLETKLDCILNRLDHVLPTQSSVRTSQENIGKDTISRLNQLLERLDRTLPLVAHSASSCKKREADRRHEDTLESILERLDRSLPSNQTPVSTSSLSKTK